MKNQNIVICLAGGIIHATLALWVSAVVRGRPVPEMYLPETLSGVALISITVLGLVLLGSIPLVLFYRNKLVAPTISLVLLFSWAFFNSYYHFEEARATGATPISLSTDSLFGMFWFVPLAIVLLLGAVEYVVRSRFDRPPIGAFLD